MKIVMKNNRNAIVSVLLVVLAVTVAVLMQQPIAQPPQYHEFEDSRTLFAIPNFLNVISNLPFVIIGGMGLYSLLISRTIKGLKRLQAGYFILFLALVLIGFGSGFYHLAPDNQRLVWDRLPITLAFMALFAIIIGEYIAAKAGRLLLYPFIVLGCSSVFYWLVTESNGAGDLRYYLLVQLLPLISIPLILWSLKPAFSHGNRYWWLFWCYVLAKMFEYYDGVIFDALLVLSGHSLKHLVAALGMLLLLNGYKKRRLTDILRR